MAGKFAKLGLPTLACAVLSGVAPADLDTVNPSLGDGSPVVDFDGPDVVEHVRRLSTNSTGGELDAGAVTAIVLGAIAVAILLAGAVWWACLRKPMAASYAAPQRTFRPLGFSLSAADGVDHLDAPDVAVEMPLLRLNASACGATGTM